MVNHARKTASKRAVALLALLMVVATACSSSTALGDAPAQSAEADAGTASGTATGRSTEEQNRVDVAARFGPSTAALTVIVNGQQMLVPELESTGAPDEVIPRLDAPSSQSSGSGFLIDIDGLPFLVTNFHVVQDALERGTSDLLGGATISATFADADGSQVPLSVVGVNPSFDLALLEVTNGGEFPDVEPIPIADSDLVEIGQTTIAIGNPFGLGASVSTGVVSSTGRFIESVGQVSIPMIQTDAAINPGNSGGALLDSSGQLIGINTSIFNTGTAAFAGIGFSVPSNLLKEAQANLELGGVSNLNDTRPSFGATLGSLQLLPPSIRAEAGFPDVGLAVLGVAEGGPADEAGLRTPEFENISGIGIPVNPDIILELDGNPVRVADDLNVAITYEADLGQEVTLTILRDGEEIELPVTLGL